MNEGRTRRKNEEEEEEGEEGEYVTIPECQVLLRYYLDTTNEEYY